MQSDVDAFEFSEITKNLNILLVDDDPIIRLILKNFLSDLFKKIFEAKDGREGLQIFNHEKIDIIITDNLMPNMNGVEMIKTIRQTDTKVPIIVVTSSSDTNFLIQFINSGVNQFLKKPLAKSNILDAIKLAIQNVILEIFKIKLQEQEVEILKYQNQQRQIQEELSLKKQKNLIINDCYLKTVQADGAKWLVDVQFNPLDIMSGDIYSIRHLNANKLFCCIIDGMGHGISAALTTILSISYLNHIIDTLLETKETYNLKTILDLYIKYIKKELFDDEIISATVAILDFQDETIEYVIFSGYPILLQTNDDRLILLKSKNLPISKYLNDYSIKKQSIANAEKILFTSDGLVEYKLDDLTQDSHSLQQFFVTTNWLHNFVDLYIDDPTKIQDDIVAIYLKKLTPTYEKQFEFSVQGRFYEILNLSKTIQALLISENVQEAHVNHYINVFSEMIMNAFEHGILKLSNQKKALMADGTYDHHLFIENQPELAVINVSLNLFSENHTRTLETVIKDPGNGFDVNKLAETLLAATSPANLQGRGIYLSKKNSDAIFYNNTGKIVTFYYTLD